MSIGFATSQKRVVEFCPPMDSGATAHASHRSPTTERDPTRTEKGNSFYSGLPVASIRAINEIAHVKRHPKGAIVFFEGDVARGVYLLFEGRANVLTAISEGRTLVLGVAQPGDLLGLNSVFGGTSHAVTVETLQPCQFAFIAREDFLKLIEDHSDACLYFALRLGLDCRSAYDVIRSMASPVPTMLARFLVSCCSNEYVEKGIVHVKLSLTREPIHNVLAALVRQGAVRSAASREEASRNSLAPPCWCIIAPPCKA